MALAFPPSCPHMAGIFYAVGAARQEVDLVVPAERIELPTFGLKNWILADKVLLMVFT